MDQKSGKMLNDSEKLNFEKSRLSIIIGVYFAVFICAVAGQINDIIMAKYLPERFRVNSTVFGMAFMMFSIGKLIMMIPLAKLSENLGRKALLLIAFGIYTIGTFLAGIATTIFQFLLFRLIKGLSSFEGVTLALINDYFEEGKRGRPIALVSSSIGLGSLIGTLIGGLFLDWMNYQTGFFVLGVISLLSIISIQFFVQNNESSHNDMISRKKQWIKGASLKFALKNKENSKKFFMGCVLGGIISFSFNGLASYTLYIILNEFLIINKIRGIVLLPIFGIYIIFTLVLGQKENSTKIIQYSSIILVLSLLSILLLLLSKRLWIFIIILSIAFGCFGIIIPSIDNFVSNQVPKENRGESMGFFRSCTLLGAIFGSLIIGYIGETFWAFFPYILSGIITFIGLVYFKIFINR